MRYFERYAARFDSNCFWKLLLLTIVWIFGCMCGANAVSETVFSSLMRSDITGRTSIVGFIVTLFVPFVLSYILYRFFNFYFILPVVFMKAFSYAYCYSGFRLTYGDAAWLVCGLALFADSLCICLLMWFWLKQASGRMNIGNSFLGCLFASLIIGCIDYVWIAPLLGNY